MKKMIICENNIIINIIICDKYIPENAFPYYDGANIGDVYSPPPTTEERIRFLENENISLKNELKACSQKNEQLEECIADIAGVVYS